MLYCSQGFKRCMALKRSCLISSLARVLALCSLSSSRVVVSYVPQHFLCCCVPQECMCHTVLKGYCVMPCSRVLKGSFVVLCQMFLEGSCIVLSPSSKGLASHGLYKVLCSTDLNGSCIV